MDSLAHNIKLTSWLEEHKTLLPHLVDDVVPHCVGQLHVLLYQRLLLLLVRAGQDLISVFINYILKHEVICDELLSFNCKK